MIDVIEFIKDVFGYVIIIVIIVLIRVYILSPIEVVGDSMEPNLQNGNIMVIDRVFHKVKEFKRFDIIAFEYDVPSYLIKRIIGLPGEKIEYNNNILYVNGIKIEEPFEYDGVTNDFSIEELGYDVIPEEMYMVIGDNREHSTDSRSFGFVFKEDITGKPFIIIWPFNKLGFVK